MTTSILDRPSEDAVRPALPVGYPRPERMEWKHPATEGECVAELRSFLRPDFYCLPEMTVHHRWTGRPMRVDLLVVQGDVTLAFEVKRPGFHLARTLHQAHDYVGAEVAMGTTLEGRIIQACFIYSYPFLPTYENGMVKLAEHYRVGVAYVNSYGNFEFGFAGDVIWRRPEGALRGSAKGWSGKAQRMLFGKRQFGGSRKRQHDQTGDQR
jgi:hypothetical protein